MPRYYVIRRCRHDVKIGISEKCKIHYNKILTFSNSYARLDIDKGCFFRGIKVNKLRKATNKEHEFYFIMEVKKHIVVNMKKKKIEFVHSF